MQPFQRHHGILVPYSGANVDTDQIVPARFLHRARKDGFGDQLFHDLRFDENGHERPDFVLNQTVCRNGTILLAGANFGCGSSREHAVWALMDYGFQAVLAPSFGDIFFNNALNNGLLTLVTEERLHQALTAAVEQDPGMEIGIDLYARTMAFDDAEWRFTIDDHRRQALLEGASEIDMTLKEIDQIAAFEVRYSSDHAWAAIEKGDA